MPQGAITGYIDVAQLVLYAFWIFFAGLIYYLHRENKREGYPLESDRSGGRIKVQGFPAIPSPKTYRLANGSEVTVPNDKRSLRPIAAAPTGPFLGAPLQPTGAAMGSDVGPGAYADRADVPDTTVDGLARIVPLRTVPGFSVASQDPDPRGLAVVGCDRQIGGTVRDLWVDRAEMLFRYLEVEVAGGRRVLLPVNFSRIGRRAVQVKAITGAQFAAVPGTAQPETVTLLEEERITAYYGAGTLYATPARAEPLV